MGAWGEGAQWYKSIFLNYIYSLGQTHTTNHSQYFKTIHHPNKIPIDSSLGFSVGQSLHMLLGGQRKPHCVGHSIGHITSPRDGDF